MMLMAVYTTMHPPRSTGSCARRVGAPWRVWLAAPGVRPLPRVPGLRWRDPQCEHKPRRWVGSRGKCSDHSDAARGAEQGAADAPLAKRLTILHFNDVYQISPRPMEPVGGAARFATAIRRHAMDDPLILFSGDCLNPSLISSFAKGEHMVPILNAIGVHAACVGNHDFDFGVEVLRQHVRSFSFPWLLSNVLDSGTGAPLADLAPSHMLTWQGVRIGLMGIVEREWLATIPCLDVARDVVFLDPVETAERLARELRAAGADLVVALTHMRDARDATLAAAAAGVQLILAGHDHEWGVRVCPPHGTLLVKSGTDFREFTRLDIALPLASPPARPTTTWRRYEVDSRVPPAADVQVIVDRYEAMAGASLEGALGWTHVELDAQSAAMRTRETALGNLLADAMRAAMRCEAAFFNGGTVRSDQVHAVGQLTMRDVVSMLPFTDELSAVELTGRQLASVLETGVSAWPAHEGRFLQVSGISFTFDPARPPGSRVLPPTIRVAGAPLDPTRRYRVATKAYLRNGKDGFECMRTAVPLHAEGNAPSLATLMRHLFMRIEALNEGLGPYVPGARHQEGDAAPACDTRPCGLAGAAPTILTHPHGFLPPEVLLQPCEEGLETLYSLDTLTGKHGVAPRVEGRIQCLAEGPPSPPQKKTMT